MKPFSMFQRSAMMFMHMSEVLEGDQPMYFSRRSFMEALGFKWQQHYTRAMKELVELNCIEARKRFGVHEYILTDQARVYFDQQRQYARREAHVSEWQRSFVYSE